MQYDKSVRHFHLLKNSFFAAAPVPPGAVSYVLIWIIYSSILLDFQQHSPAVLASYAVHPYFPCITVVSKFCFFPFLSPVFADCHFRIPVYVVLYVSCFFFNIVCQTSEYL